MNTTAAQNVAHHTDIAWTKSKGKSFRHDGELYISEYVNLFTGQTIRKSWRMTGCDWHIFDAAGSHTGSAYSLTWAKMEANS
ncbi:MAG: hypothetical protein JWP32_2919 [Schumannella sp.]|nr:hypothetical protein [Schumannella sp.]